MGLCETVREAATREKDGSDVFAVSIRDDLNARRGKLKNGKANCL
jgi:hypothetical protein